MNNKKQFLDYILSRIEHHGPIRARAMFGGYGIYYKAAMFGLIADNVLYFRIDDENKADYIEHEAKHFVYTGSTKSITLPYMELPEEILHNDELLPIWIEKSYLAAERYRAKKSKQSIKKLRS